LPEEPLSDSPTLLFPSSSKLTLLLLSPLLSLICPFYWLPPILFCACTSSLKPSPFPPISFGFFPRFFSFKLCKCWIVPERGGSPGFWPGMFPLPGFSSLLQWPLTMSRVLSPLGRCPLARTPVFGFFFFSWLFSRLKISPLHSIRVGTYHIFPPVQFSPSTGPTKL